MCVCVCMCAFVWRCVCVPYHASSPPSQTSASNSWLSLLCVYVCLCVFVCVCVHVCMCVCMLLCLCAYFGNDFLRCYLPLKHALSQLVGVSVVWRRESQGLSPPKRNVPVKKRLKTFSWGSLVGGWYSITGTSVLYYIPLSIISWGLNILKYLFMRDRWRYLYWYNLNQKMGLKLRSSRMGMGIQDICICVYVCMC